MEFYVATRRVVAFAVAYAVVITVAAAFVYRYANIPRTLQARGIVIFVLVLGLIALGVVLGILITTVFWIYSSVKQSREHGMPPYGHLGYYGIGAFFLLFVLAYGVPGLWVSAGVRVLACALLIAGVLHTRNWLRARSAPGRPYAADRYSIVTGGDPVAPLAAQPTADDWNASQWDPSVQEEIERRRRREQTR
ncbi:hypothetical protein ACPPVO_45460 [Dactylosporangium sp. McL0621]|uniref:hypothetical protein n=1 Tax=Dactylosporangium sp. McL0621 TaxID=3415678 RepID=UPI003CEA488A